MVAACSLCCDGRFQHHIVLLPLKGPSGVDDQGRTFQGSRHRVQVIYVHLWQQWRASSLYALRSQLDLAADYSPVS